MMDTMLKQLVKMLPKDAPAKLVNGLVEDGQRLLAEAIAAVPLEPGEYAAVINYSVLTTSDGVERTVAWISTVDAELNPMRKIISTHDPKQVIDSLHLADKLINLIGAKAS